MLRLINSFFKKKLSTFYIKWRVFFRDYDFLTDGVERLIHSQNSDSFSLGYAFGRRVFHYFTGFLNSFFLIKEDGE